jgi:hypothetical protein
LIFAPAMGGLWAAPISGATAVNRLCSGVPTGPPAAHHRDPRP